MNFLKLFMRGVALLPSLLQGVETLFGAKTGDQKKEAVTEIVNNAIMLPVAVANKSIADPNGFAAGLSQVIDGIVACLNASVWFKAPPAE